MVTRDPWEEILELARRIDDGVAARRGVNPSEAMELARAVMLFQQRLSGGPPPGPSTGPSQPDCAEDEQRSGASEA